MALVLSPRRVSPPSRRAPVLLLAAKPGERRLSPRRPERVKGRRGRGPTGGEGTSASPSSLRGPAPLCGAGWREFGLKGVNSSLL